MTTQKVHRVARFDYEQMVQKALRQVMQEALTYVEKNGLPGTHHFYITFETNRPDVVVPEFLRDKHPEEVTIVLQHQFWDLKVTDAGFSVLLSFNDVHEKIEVPYAAVISFLDPSVKFGLQFIPDEPPGGSTDRGEGAPEKPEGGKKDKKSQGNNVISLENFRKK